MSTTQIERILHDIDVAHRLLVLTVENEADAIERRILKALADSISRAVTRYRLAHEEETE